jgi:flagellar basal body L-ring protein FlgH
MKKVVCLILVLLIICSLCSCTSNEQEQVKENLKIEQNNTNIRIWIDEETGVQYIIWRDSYKGGITPRLNADGTLYHPTEKGGAYDA